MTKVKPNDKSKTVKILVVSEYRVIFDLIRSAFKDRRDVDVKLAAAANNNSRSSRTKLYSANNCGPYDVVIYDLDSAQMSPKIKLQKLNAFLNQKLKHKIESLFFISSEPQLDYIGQYVSFLDDSLISKPFTFMQIKKMVNDMMNTNAILTVLKSSTTW